MRNAYYWDRFDPVKGGKYCCVMAYIFSPQTLKTRPTLRLSVTKNLHFAILDQRRSQPLPAHTHWVR